MNETKKMKTTRVNIIGAGLKVLGIIRPLAFLGKFTLALFMAAVAAAARRSRSR